MVYNSCNLRKNLKYTVSDIPYKMSGHWLRRGFLGDAPISQGQGDFTKSWLSLRNLLIQSINYRHKGLEPSSLFLELGLQCLRCFAQRCVPSALQLCVILQLLLFGDYVGEILTKERRNTKQLG